MIAEGDKVVSRWHASGTHQGQFVDMAATGKEVNYNGITIYRLEQNKIKEYWVVVDMFAIWQQLT